MKLFLVSYERSFAIVYRERDENKAETIWERSVRRSRHLLKSLRISSSRQIRFADYNPQCLKNRIETSQKDVISQNSQEKSIFSNVSSEMAP